MATVKGTAIQYGIASNATTGVSGQAAVTSLSGGHRAETKRIKGNNGDTMSFVICDQTVEVNATIVCTSSLNIPAVGDTVTLSKFDDGDLNRAYYCLSSDAKHRNQSELTASVSLIDFAATFTGP